MKTLLIVRHAKSSWSHPEFSDFDRPLNRRGNNDAPMMGGIIREQGVKPDLIVSSPAKRAITTAKFIAGALGYDSSKISEDHDIYGSGPKYILKLLSQLDDSLDTVMIVGHNPDLTYVSSLLCQEEFSNVPTCGVVCIDFDFDKWEKIITKSGDLRFFDYPKNSKVRNQGASGLYNK